MKITRSAKIAGNADFYTHGFEVELEWGDIKADVEGMYKGAVPADALGVSYCLDYFAEYMLYMSAAGSGVLSEAQIADWVNIVQSKAERMQNVFAAKPR